MVRFPTSISRLLMLGGASALTLAVAGRHLRADGPDISSSSTSSSAPSTNLLQQLSSDTQKLYLQARHSIVRVQLPTPLWLEQYNERQEFIQKWGRVMDPSVRSKIIEEQERALSGVRTPTTAPAMGVPPAIASSQPAAGPSLGLAVSGPFVGPGRDELHTSRPGSVRGSLTLYAVGLIVDDQGHAVFPVFVDRQAIGNSMLRAVTGDGDTATAKFIGSDAITNLTVLQLDHPTGVPAPLGHRRPDDGVIALAIAPDGGAHLAVWNNQRPEPGFAILTDGSVAGFGFEGHFMGASTAKPIVDQLIATGEIRRPQLGVWVQEVGKDDPLRRQTPQLGTSPAILVVGVQAHSPAAIAGVQQNDLVLSVGGDSVGDTATFAAVIATRRGNTKLIILRGSELVELVVDLQPPK